MNQPGKHLSFTDLRICRLAAGLHKLATRVAGSRISRMALVALVMGCSAAMASEEPSVNRLRVALQAKYADLIEVKLNSVAGDVKFRIVDMRKPIIEVDGKKYCAFRFKTGEKVHQLTWCFRKPPGLRGWYILRESGTMQGFNTYRDFIIRDDTEGWGSVGDLFVVQSLPGTHFEPNTGYIMWFQISEAGDSSINLSLNMTNVPDHSRFSAVFPTIKL